MFSSWCNETWKIRIFRFGYLPSPFEGRIISFLLQLILRPKFINVRWQPVKYGLIMCSEIKIQELVIKINTNEVCHTHKCPLALFLIFKLLVSSWFGYEETLENI